MVGIAPSELLWRSALLVGPLSLCAAGSSRLLVGHRRPIAILLLFLGISIPMMERHLLAEHPTYAEYQWRVSPFVPWVSR
jgi:steroid 5-alpha reductase family enzyme